jgi:hypothetical protein
MSLNASKLIGINVNDEMGREIGKVISFVIDSSGQVKEVFIQNRNERFAIVPFHKLKISGDKVYLKSDMIEQVTLLSENIPIAKKKRNVLDKLLESKKISSETYESVSKWLDKSIEQMEKEAQNIIDQLDKQLDIQDKCMKNISLARTFLEIENAMENLEDEIYNTSLKSLIRENEKIAQNKANLEKTKVNITRILTKEEEKIEEIKEEVPTPKEPKTPISLTSNKQQEEPSLSKEEPVLVRITEEE